ncbi:FAD-binding and (Fe-S)-binding domain-containing protein [Aquimarina agarilytica]|uniref:FAD-binding and (Fe-S)-binding domain-containing protein n=1 Tax=Aquimarina agarilytica TaxID=1087449 RepID=UPI0002899F5A|nr:FAD-binding and (Fe-S)-binding domain-containing protein [Aquimarina agarilytica]
MSVQGNTIDWEALQTSIDGELQYDKLTKMIYATDASVYRKLPMAVVFPKNAKDIQELIKFATKNQLNVIPRTAGTSLAGQCVGEGIIVDVSKYLTKIIALDTKKKTVTVEPGVIRDDLNRYLAPYGLFFGPNTSTSNRCMIGGMVGNNSSGTTSIKYGVTRDKLISLKTILSDGEEVVFSAISKEDFYEKLTQDDQEGVIYKTINSILEKKEHQDQIIENYPKPEIHRRNTGYALDVLLKNSFFGKEKEINLCDILSGSEGTLAFSTEITLQLDDLPPVKSAMIAAHFESISLCMKAVEPVMKHPLYTCEMMDKTILDCTKNNIEQSKNRFFVEGDPKAILMLELRAETDQELSLQIESLLDTLKDSDLSYALPVLYATDIDKALELRKAGLGLLGNMVGDRKAVACIEDTAVAIGDLSAYIDEFTALMEGFGQDAVYYAHAGAGEIHLRPILDLKKGKDVTLFKEITDAVAHLVKKYKGSMSGEHGDGIVRSTYIPEMIGIPNYELLKHLKKAFDPKGIFNQGKIIDPLVMDENLRYVKDREEPKITTELDFSDSQGILRVAEKCNGSGDCRKSVEAGGVMCPSYRATKNEKDTTRARANVLREVLTHSDQQNKFNSAELKQVFDLCVSCKACASECPSNVDIASLKAEFLYQYNKSNSIVLRDKVFAYNDSLNRIASKTATLSNFVFTNTFTSGILKSILGIAEKRRLPVISNQALTVWLTSFLETRVVTSPVKELYLFVDEFINYQDNQLGKDVVELLTALNYKIHFLPHKQSGRALISKGFLDEAKKVVNENVKLFKDKVSSEIPLVGIEPSAILSFRDEYIRLADDKAAAAKLSTNVLLIDEFIAKEIDKGNITSDQFSEKSLTTKLHIHCHQKSLSNTSASFKIINLPKNSKVSIITAGCCGMAGSFGYEKEHYDVSMQMGELSLFPKIRKTTTQTCISATGISCRHQIKDGTKRIAMHPISILKQFLI